jgi:hypothetical protein
MMVLAQEPEGSWPIDNELLELALDDWADSTKQIK